MELPDTATPDPYYPNSNPLIGAFGPDPFVYHVFQWKDSSVTDLGSLPGANSSAASLVTENGLVSGESLNGAIDPLMDGRKRMLFFGRTARSPISERLADMRAGRAGSTATDRSLDPLGTLCPILIHSSVSELKGARFCGTTTMACKTSEYSAAPMPSLYT